MFFKIYLKMKNLFYISIHTEFYIILKYLHFQYNIYSLILNINYLIIMLFIFNFNKTVYK